MSCGARTLHNRFDLLKIVYDSLCRQSEAPIVGTMQRRDLELALSWFEHEISKDNANRIEVMMAVIREAQKVELERLREEAEARERHRQVQEAREKHDAEEKEKKRKRREEKRVIKKKDGSMVIDEDDATALVAATDNKPEKVKEFKAAENPELKIRYSVDELVDLEEFDIGDEPCSFAYFIRGFVDGALQYHTFLGTVMAITAYFHASAYVAKAPLESLPQEEEEGDEIITSPTSPIEEDPSALTPVTVTAEELVAMCVDELNPLYDICSHADSIEFVREFCREDYHTRKKKKRIRKIDLEERQLEEKPQHAKKKKHGPSRPIDFLEYMECLHQIAMQTKIRVCKRLAEMLVLHDNFTVDGNSKPMKLLASFLRTLGLKIEESEVEILWGGIRAAYKRRLEHATFPEFCACLIALDSEDPAGLEQTAQSQRALTLAQDAMWERRKAVFVEAWPQLFRALTMYRLEPGTAMRDINMMPEHHLLFHVMGSWQPLYLTLNLKLGYSVTEKCKEWGNKNSIDLAVASPFQLARTLALFAKPSRTGQLLQKGLADLTSTFVLFDSDRDDRIAAHEFAKCMHALGRQDLASDYLQGLVKDEDPDEDGHFIRFSQFVDVIVAKVCPPTMCRSPLSIYMC